MKWLVISCWSLFAIAIVMLLAFTSQENVNRACELPTINIDSSNGHEFIRAKDILQMMKDIGYNYESISLGAVNCKDIEHRILGMTGVANAEVYKSLSGSIKVDIIQRNPICRIWNKNGVNFYLDDKGCAMPITPHYTARVVVVNGHINEPMLKTSVLDPNFGDSLLQSLKLDNIYQLVNHIEQDDFLKAQIVQVYVNKDGEYELVPRVGNHRIMFGKVEDIENKFKKLKVFYEKGIQPEEFNLYDTITLKYKNQIICSKR